MRVGPRRKLLDLSQKRLQCGRLRGKFLVIPRRGRVGRQSQHVRQVHAGIRARHIDVGREVEDLRKQNHAIQVGVVLVFQQIGQHRRARRAVALAKDELRRVPPRIFGIEPFDKPRKRARVAVDAPESFLRVLPRQPSEPGSGHVDEHQVAYIQQTVRVVHHGVRRGRQVGIAYCYYVLRSQRSHVQPHRGAARSAVIEKCNRPVFGLGAGLEVRHVEHPRHWRSILRFVGFVQCQLASRLRFSVRPQLRILAVGRAHRDGSGNRGVGNMLPAHVDRALRGGVGRQRGLRRFFRGFFRSRGFRRRLVVLRAG